MDHDWIWGFWGWSVNGWGFRPPIPCTLTEWHPFWTSRKKAEPENWDSFSDSMGCTINPLDFRHVLCHHCDQQIPCFMVPQVLENFELGAWHGVPEKKNQEQKVHGSIHPKVTDSSTNTLKNGIVWFLVSLIRILQPSNGCPNISQLSLSCRDGSFPTIDVRRKWRGRMLDTLQPSPLPTTPGGWKKTKGGTERDPLNMWQMNNYLECTWHDVVGWVSTTDFFKERLHLKMRSNQTWVRLASFRSFRL